MFYRDSLDCIIVYIFVIKKINCIFYLRCCSRDQLNIELFWEYLFYELQFWVIIVEETLPNFQQNPQILELLLFRLDQFSQTFPRSSGRVFIIIHGLIIVWISFAGYLMHIGENSHKNQRGITFDFLIFLPISEVRQILLQLCLTITNNCIDSYPGFY